MKLFKKIKYIIIVISFITVIIGLIKVNIINTRALSPLGNSKENYEKIKDSFGDEFSNFINDNALVKIYEDNKIEGILVRIGEKDYKITNKSYIIEKIEDAVDGIQGFYNKVFDTIME